MTSTTVPTGIRDAVQDIFASINLPLRYCINFWDTDQLQVSGAKTDAAPSLTLQFRHPGVLRAILLKRDPLVLADAYLNGFFEISGKLEALILLFRQMSRFQLQPARQLRTWLEALTLPPLPETSSPETSPSSAPPSETDRQAIQHHYDVGNAFYRLWLDSHLVYSCAHFEHPEMSLDEAQMAKLDLICRKLRLQPGETLLDVGCGWGALLRWAVTHYGVQGYGITLSDEQLAFNRQQIEAQGLGERLQIELRDYRDLPQAPTFDKAVSVGMIEHVGKKNYPIYFDRIRASLKPGGLFLNHGITATREWDGSSIGERFINRYIFPNGELTRLSTTLTAAEDNGWEVVDVDGWRPHYAKTLRHWAANLERVLERATDLVGDRETLFWRIYLIGSALAFENNDMGIYQALLRPQTDPEWTLPLTRNGWLC
ncbi:Sarcosine/dimethylglycine N-methyltransferase [Halomicronema hongdechloris C2206]|uniref:Sarcosine/dimethylglycine N-methyltransferase n=1 Tax=Halomicronema hongdechloris C2206 TaxID=1641165 RepID=A0A1Z3HV78_9CYAN|nr:class I SAM-dependent methyltransferase [Halomicronema hongdechloris]ASC74193.1 Sarcosine/dimethylglycine N-methyltransferase [Halomicronema hongdechloris C2206]